MKKLLTGILALALAAAMSIPAFAANSATNDGTAGTDITVNGTYQAGTAAADVISVDLVWDEMSFTYTAPSKGEWNATEHKYENATEGGWAATNGTNPKITVTNHSNTGIKADFAFATDIADLNGSFTSDSLVLATAENTELASAPKGETAFSVSGTAIDEDKSLGTITVTVGKYVEYEVTADQFANLMTSADSFRIARENVEFQFDGETVFMMYKSGTEELYTFDGTNYYYYSKYDGIDEYANKWVKGPLRKVEYDGAFKFNNILLQLKDHFAEFDYDESTQSYQNNSAFTFAGAYSSRTAAEKNVQLFFENGALKKAVFTFDNGDTENYSDFGEIHVTIPTPVHEHSYAMDQWAMDENLHWHPETCGCSGGYYGNESHNFENGVCTVCGYVESTGE